MTERKTRRKYTQEFKLEAIQLVEARGGNAAEVARNLGIDSNMLSRWIRECRHDSEYAFPGQGKLREPEAAFRKLKKELADTQMERDILKKALSIFSRQ